MLASEKVQQTLIRKSNEEIARGIPRDVVKRNLETYAKKFFKNLEYPQLLEYINQL